LDHSSRSTHARAVRARQTPFVHITAKAEYAMRALLTLAAHDGGPLTADKLAGEQSLPVKFLENILVDLRRGGLVRSQRGAEGGYRLARPATEISAADVLRLVDGPLAEVRGVRPEVAKYEGAAKHLQEVWVAARASLRGVLDNVTLADIASGDLPEHVTKLTGDPDAWRVR
jgi:Rrf2 family protein